MLFVYSRSEIGHEMFDAHRVLPVSELLFENCSFLRTQLFDNSGLTVFVKLDEFVNDGVKVVNRGTLKLYIQFLAHFLL